MKNIRYKFLFLGLLGLFISCEPEVDDKIDLGDPPVPSFEIIAGATPNDFTLVNTTPGAFIINWDVEGVGSFQGEEVDVQINFQGDYLVNLTVFSQGGSASTSKTLTVTEDNQNSCFGNFELLTDCGTKVWKLAPEAGALNVGPSLNETWWQNSDSDVGERECHFNDEYIFSEDGTFEYDNKGDFWADTDADGNITPADLGLNPGCQQAPWPAAYAAWDSGVYSFSANENSLTVSGEGAWMGLYKVASTGEVTSPQTSVTFSISELTENRMVIFADHGSGVWRFTFVSE